MVHCRDSYVAYSNSRPALISNTNKYCLKKGIRTSSEYFLLFGFVYFAHQIDAGNKISFDSNLECTKIPQIFILVRNCA